jgi:hypothetical protein
MMKALTGKDALEEQKIAVMTSGFSRITRGAARQNN